MDVDHQQRRTGTLSPRAASAVLVITVVLLIAGSGAAVRGAAPGGGNGGSHGGQSTTTTSAPATSTTTSSSSTTTTPSTLPTTTIPPVLPGDPYQSACVGKGGCSFYSHGGTVVWSSEPQYKFSIAIYRGGSWVASSRDHVGSFADTLPGDWVSAWSFFCEGIGTLLGGCDHQVPAGYMVVANP